MTPTNLLTAIVPPEVGGKPRDAELDLFGLTHPGKVRKENQDHFLVATVHHQVVIHGTSLPDPNALPLRGERLATIALVADGVGVGPGGREASRLAVESITGYVSSAMLCFHGGTSADREFLEALRAAALKTHAAVRSRALGKTDPRTMATTLTLVVAVWPHLYVTQVGDSRCYLFQEGRLRQVTRDQTVAQSLVDRGALAAADAPDSPFSHVLSSAIGGAEAAPEVTRFRLDRGTVALLCSDGLPKHVSDTELEQRIRGMKSSEQLCRDLLALTLERGASDNVTVLVGRARPHATT